MSADPSVSPPTVFIVSLRLDDGDAAGVSLLGPGDDWAKGVKMKKIDGVKWFASCDMENPFNYKYKIYRPGDLTGVVEVCEIRRCEVLGKTYIDQWDYPSLTKVQDEPPPEISIKESDDGFTTKAGDFDDSKGFVDIPSIDIGKFSSDEESEEALVAGVPEEDAKALEEFQNPDEIFDDPGSLRGPMSQAKVDVSNTGSKPGENAEELVVDPTYEPYGSSYDDVDLKNPDADTKLDPKPKKNTSNAIVRIIDTHVASDALRSWVIYTVQTTFISPSERVHVERRYSDFLWLRDRLAKKYKYYIMPPLPRKVALSMNHFTLVFRQYRKKLLQVFLQRIANHRALSKSKDFKRFLREQDYQQNTKKGTWKEWGQKSTSILMAKSKEMAGRLPHIHKEVAVQAGTKRVEDDDPWFQAVRELTDGAAVSFRKLLAASQMLSAKERGFNKIWSSLSQISADFSSVEVMSNSNSLLYKPLVKLSEVAGRLSELETKLAESEPQKFGETVEDFLGYSMVVKAALHKRYVMMLQLEEQQKVRGKRKGTLNETKLDQERVLNSAEGYFEAEFSHYSTKQKFDRIAERNKQCMQKYIDYKHEDFITAMADMADLHILCAEQRLLAWKELKESLDAVPPI